MLLPEIHVAVQSGNFSVGKKYYANKKTYNSQDQCNFLLFIPEEAGAVGGSEEHIYYYNEIVNTGLDNGYSGNDTIKKDDPHYGWSLGRFSIKGYSAKKETDGNLVFLKNVKNNNENDNEGNKVSLYFTLEQDIDKLNGKDNTKISDDENGYDEHIGTAQNKFGRGTLIVTHTDYTNTKRDPEIHTNFLKVKAAKGKEQLIAFCDALTKPRVVKDFYENVWLIAITKELVEMLRKNCT